MIPATTLSLDFELKISAVIFHIHTYFSVNIQLNSCNVTFNMEKRSGHLVIKYCVSSS